MNEFLEEEHARKLRGMAPWLGVTIYPESYPRHHWSAGSRLVDFISRYTGFFFESSATCYLDRESVEDAAGHLIHETLRPGDGGVIALSHRGEVAMVRSTEGMFRGRCLPGGDVEVRIWDAPEPLEAAAP